MIGTLCKVAIMEFRVPSPADLFAETSTQFGGAGRTKSLET